MKLVRRPDSASSSPLSQGEPSGSSLPVGASETASPEKSAPKGFSPRESLDVEGLEAPPESADSKRDARYQGYWDALGHVQLLDRARGAQRLRQVTRNVRQRGVAATTAGAGGVAVFPASWWLAAQSAGFAEGYAIAGGAVGYLGLFPLILGAFSLVKAKQIAGDAMPKEVTEQDLAGFLEELETSTGAHRAALVCRAELWRTDATDWISHRLTKEAQEKLDTVVQEKESLPPEDVAAAHQLATVLDLRFLRPHLDPGQQAREARIFVTAWQGLPKDERDSLHALLEPLLFRQETFKEKKLGADAKLILHELFSRPSTREESAQAGLRSAQWTRNARWTSGRIARLKQVLARLPAKEQVKVKSDLRKQMFKDRTAEELPSALYVPLYDLLFKADAKDWKGLFEHYQSQTGNLQPAARSHLASRFKQMPPAEQQRARALLEKAVAKAELSTAYGLRDLQRSLSSF